MSSAMFADVGMVVRGRCGGWEDAYFKGQIGMEYGWWMICACLVGFYACAIPTRCVCVCVCVCV